MPGCAAVGCNNRSEKGYTMKCFPRDPVLRTLWKKKVGRADWEPSNNSFLCSSHFDKNQWFINSSGKIKLKKDAVPSIFKITSTRKSPKKKQKMNIQNFDDTDLDQFEIEYLDNNSPFFLNLANQKNMPHIINIQSQNAEITGQILQNISVLSGDTLKNLQNENIIIVADEHNREIGKIIKDSSIMYLESAKDKENFQLLSKAEKSTPGDVKVEIVVKEEVHENSLQGIDFDVLEKKLQAICHETDSNNSKDSFKKINGHSTRSSFSLEEMDNAFENAKDNSFQEINYNTQPKRMKRCKKISSHSKSDEIIITEQKNGKLSSKTNDTDKTTRDIIKDLEIDEIEEYKAPLKKQCFTMKSNQNSNSKIIIKNNIDVSNKNVTVLPVNNKNSDINVLNVNNVNTTNEKQLAAKIEVQAEVIEKLKNQLILYKDMESHVKRISGLLEIKNKEIEVLMGKITANQLPTEKKVKIPSSLQEASKPDLIERIMELESQVKSLTKVTNEEIKNRKQLECKVRSKVSNIKELNWKLDKASKILERTIKNMNNYKKRMYDMRTLLKRNDLMSFKNSMFHKILICHRNREFTNDALEAALKIQEACGSNGYNKLLEYNFPLPFLKNFNKKNVIIKREDVVKNNEPDVHENKSVEDNSEAITKNNQESIIIYNNESTENHEVLNGDNNVTIKLNHEPDENNGESMKSNIEMEVIIDEEDEDDVKMEEVEYLDTEFLKKSNDIVMQTVQDIFNDCSDDEDLNELKKHILIERIVEDVS